MASGAKWRKRKTLADVENAIQNMRAAMIRTEEYVKEQQV